MISSTAAVIGQAIASLGRMWWGFNLNTVWALMLLSCAVLLVPRYGALGLATAFLASYLVHALTSALAYRFISQATSSIPVDLGRTYSELFSQKDD